MVTKTRRPAAPAESVEKCLVQAAPEQVARVIFAAVKPPEPRHWDSSRRRIHPCRHDETCWEQPTYWCDTCNAQTVRQCSLCEHHAAVHEAQGHRIYPYQTAATHS